MNYAQASGISCHAAYRNTLRRECSYRECVQIFFSCKHFHNIVNEVTIRLNRSVPTEIVGWNLLNIKDSLE